MEIPTYVFQSPYSSAVQVGRPDPQAVTQEKTSEAVDVLSKTGNVAMAEAEAYLTQVSSGASVNVAQSLTDTGLNSSLEGFSSLNQQSKALEAYSS